MNVLTQIQEAIVSAEKNNIRLDFRDTISAIEAIKGISLNAATIEKVIIILSEVHQPTPSIKELTKREQQIFNLIGVGLKSREIGSLLNISKTTVGTHRKNIVKKMKGHGSLQELAFKHVHDVLK